MGNSNYEQSQKVLKCVEEYTKYFMDFIEKYKISNNINSKDDFNHIGISAYEMADWTIKKYDEIIKDAPTQKSMSILLAFLWAFLNTIIKTFSKNDDDDKKMITYYGLIRKALIKFECFLLIYERQHYEETLSSYRMFLENIVILAFLLKNDYCINDYRDFAVYKMATKRYGLDQIEKNIEKKYGSILNDNYGWAYSFFNKEKITFEDILNDVCRKEIMIEQLLKLSSATKYSYTSTMINPIVDEMYSSLLQTNLEHIGLPLLIKCIFSVFILENEFSANIFLSISNALFPEKYDLIHKIKLIESVDYIHLWPSIEEEKKWIDSIKQNGT